MGVIPSRKWCLGLGFSRGAAQSIELAHRLAKHGITVDFLGLYDPVYALGLPGQSSLIVDNTEEGKKGNFVTRELSSNVTTATVLYAMNETRSWFPATKVLAAKGSSTQVINIASPGVHSDVGGHWGNNEFIQQLTLRTMINNASPGLFVYNGIDPQIQALLNSDYTVFRAMQGVEENKPVKYFGNWKKIALTPSKWQPVTPMKYRELANRQDTIMWRAGGFGAQSDKGWREYAGNVAHTAESGIKGFLLGPIGSALVPDEQPRADHYRRNLNWVKLGLWNTYSGIDPKFMKRVYNMIAHPDGGWRSNFGDSEVLPGFPDLE